MLYAFHRTMRITHEAVFCAVYTGIYGAFQSMKLRHSKLLMFMSGLSTS